MRSVSASSIIPARPGELFAFVADPANLPQWQAGILSAEVTSSGPIAERSTARVVRQLMGQRIVADLTVTDYQPDRRLELTSTVGGVAATALLELSAAADGTQLDFSMEIRAASPFMAPLEGMIAGAAQNDLAQSLARLRALFSERQP